MSEDPQPRDDAEPAALPPPAELVGRDIDLEALREQIDALPLVTIVGTGGVGKTSLARVLLARHAVESRQNVHWVDLAPLRDGTQVVPAIAKSLGVDLDGFAKSTGDFIRALAHVRAVVALDNCEHLLHEVSAFLRDAMAGAPGVRWLATSQEPLHVAGELVYRLEPLLVPTADATVAEAMGCGAIALLWQRASAADRHFALDASNVAAAVDICRQLDGLPLAIEMAAARVGTLGLTAVYDQLGQRLHLLAGPREAPARHHTLQSTFEWSFELLSSVEQKVFRRLEPFVGGFPIGLAQRMAHDSEQGDEALDDVATLEALSALVDKSLLQASGDPQRRYQLFETARRYARSKLEEAKETSFARRRHAHVVAAWFDTAQADYDTLRDDEWMARYVPEHHNVKAALDWACTAEEPDLLARLVAGLAQIESLVRGPADIVHCAIPMDTLARAAMPLRAVACLELSLAHFLDGDRRIGTDLSLRALEDFRTVGNAAGTVRAIAQLVRLYESRPGMMDEAKKAAELLRQMSDETLSLRTRLFCAITGGLQYQGGRSVARLQELEDIAHRAGLDSLAAVCRVHITDELLIECRFDEVVQTAQRFLDAGELRPRMRALILLNQLLALVQLGRIAAARGPALAALRALPSATYLAVAPFALAAARAGRLVDAALLTGYCDHIRRARDERPDPAEAAASDETLVRLRGGLAPARLDELMLTGAGLSAAEVLALAMSSISPSPSPSTAAVPAVEPGRWS